LLDEGVPEARIEVIHRGADLGRFAFVDRSDRNGSPEVELLMVGRLIEKKGHALALRALQRLRAGGHRARLRIVGAGPEAEPLARQAEELGVAGSVQFAGAVDHAGVREAMERADILLQCSGTASDGDAEGLPNVVVEGAATGLPVVATENGGIAEAVRSGQTGLLVPEADAPALAGALVSLIEARELRLRLGRGGHELMRAEFDIRAQVSRYVQLYRELAEQFRPGHERMRRGFLDERLLRTLRVTFESETWVTELVAELLGRPLRDDQGTPWVERSARSFRMLPEPLKKALKRALVPLLKACLEPRHRSRQELEELTLRFVRSGGSARQVDPRWSLRRIHRQMEMRASAAHGEEAL
jgi:hypothetical protein